MATEITDVLLETSLTTSTNYLLKARTDYVFNLNGDGVWKFYDGSGYVTYAVGSVDGKNFMGTTPVSGKVQCTVSSGTVVASFGEA